MKDKGLKPTFEITIEQATPTIAHMALTELVKRGLVKVVLWVITPNNISFLSVHCLD